MKGAGGPPALHQFVPLLMDNDAIGEHTRSVAAALRRRGIRSDIFVHRLAPGQETEAHSFRDYEGLARPDDVLLYQVATPSELADYLAAQRRRLAIYFHNLTPGHIRGSWDPGGANAAGWGRFQLERLAPRCELAMAPSLYSLEELSLMGFSPCAQVPLMGGLSGSAAPADPRTAERLTTGRASGEASWLFVGRLSPHKRQHLLVAALAAARAAYGPTIRLTLIGRADPPSYAEALRAYAAELGASDSVDFESDLPAGALRAHYRAASVFVCASAHEGFCIPLVEAMEEGLPVVALRSTAVPETLGDAGLVIEGGPVQLAAAAHLVCSDEALRRTLVAAGRARHRELSQRSVEETLIEALAPLLGGIGEEAA